MTSPNWETKPKLIGPFEVCCRVPTTRVSPIGLSSLAPGGEMRDPGNEAECPYVAVKNKIVQDNLVFTQQREL